MTTIGKELQHGFYETYIGTQTIPGCDCKPCEAGYKRRLEFQNSLSRFNPSSPRKQPKPTGSKFDGREHGARATYVAGCRCRECTDAPAAYTASRSASAPDRVKAQWREYYARNKEAIRETRRIQYAEKKAK